MARYADAQCDGCGRVYPANRLRRVKDEIKTGESVTPSGDPNDYRRTVTTHYENQFRRLCSACLAKRRNVGCMKFLGTIALFLVGIGGFWGLSQHPKSAASPAVHVNAGVRSAEKQFREATSGIFGTAPKRSTKHTTPADTGLLSSTATNPDSSQTSETAQSDEDIEQPVDPTSSDEVKAAIEKAFQKGKPVRWRNSISHGYAVPSVEANAVGCRAVYVTSKNMGKDWQSPVQTVCS